MRIRSFISISASLCICLTLTACGNSSETKFDTENSTTTTLHDTTTETTTEAKKEIIPTKTVTTEVTEAIETSGETKKLTESKTDSNTNYKPSEEIINASFSSGLVQIGNDIFRQGGYSTVDHFIEEYGDRYDMSDINPNGLISSNNIDTTSAVIISLSDSNIKIKIHYIPKMNEKNKTRIGDAIITDIHTVTDQDQGFLYVWFPKGIRNNAEGFDYYNIPEFLEKNNFNSVTEDYVNERFSYPDTYSELSKVYFDGDLDTNTGIFGFFAEAEDINIFGVKPIFYYQFFYQYEDASAYRFDISTIQWNR